MPRHSRDDMDDLPQRRWWDGGGDAWARKRDSDTSKKAARAARGAKASALERLVVETLRRLGGAATSEEVADACGVNLQSISPRFRPLADGGLIVETDERRPGRSGKGRIVWKTK